MILKKLSIIFSTLIFMLFAVNGVYEDNLLSWQFEEGSGNIVLDSSGSNYYGILTGATFDAGTKKWGNFALKFDGNNDYLQTITPAPIPNTMTLNFWVYKESQGGERTFFLIKNDVIEHFKLNYNQDTSTLTIYYLDNTSTTQSININYVFPLNTWKMVSFVVDYPTNSLKLSIDNSIIYDSIEGNTFVNQDTDNYLKLGNDILGSNDFKGRMDSFNIFDFEPSTQQYLDLFSSNSISLTQQITPVDENMTINNLQEIDLITSYNPPESSNISSQLVTFSAILNQNAYCDLYIDNSLVYTTPSKILAFNYQKQYTENGVHSYFLTCYYDFNSTRYYELTPITNFEVIKPEKTIEFYLYDVNNNLLDANDLYLATPCFTDKELSKYYIPDREIYIQKLENGQANFNLSYTNNYDFCLLKGKLNYQDDTYSLNYDLVDIGKQTELGKLFVGSETLTYSLVVDDTDLYKVTSPQFWGETWAGLFQMIIGILLGGLIIGIGLMAGNDKLIVVGGLIIAIGMGVSITTIVGGILV